MFLELIRISGIICLVTSPINNTSNCQYQENWCLEDVNNSNSRNGPRVMSQGMDIFQDDHETSTRPVANFNNSVWFTTRQTSFKNTASQNKHGGSYLLL